jgi:4-amino-4-deoxy-L-arabinose transferase-like glycosyltransferase
MGGRPWPAYRANLSARVPILTALIAVALGLRIAVLVTSARLGADEAVPGLMARHIVTSGELPVFYWGQDYFGAAEMYLIAALFAVFGFHWWLVFVPALVASVALVPLTYMLGGILGPRPAAFLAALPVAIPTPMLSRMLGNAGGGFALGFALQIGALVCLLRAIESTSGRQRWILGGSLLLGVGVWVWQPTLVALAPVLAVLLARTAHGRKYVVAQLWPALLGLAPMLIYNVATGFPTLAALSAKFRDQELTGASDLGAGVALLVVALGGGEETLGGANVLQGLVVASAFVLQPPVIGLMRWRCPEPVWRQRARITVVVVLVAMSNLIVAHAGARYLIPVTLLGFALCGALLATLGRTSRVAMAAVLSLGVVVFGVGNLRDYVDVSGVMANETLSRVDDTVAAIEALDARGLRTGYADYWTAYPITYLSAERIIVAPSLPLTWGPSADRYPAYAQQVNAAPSPFLLVDRACASEPFTQTLEPASATYRIEQVGRWILIWDIRPPPGAESATHAALRRAIADQRVC